MDPIEILIGISGKSRDNCLQMYEVANYDIDAAALYLLEIQTPVLSTPQKNTSQRTPGSGYSSSAGSHPQTPFEGQKPGANDDIISPYQQFSDNPSSLSIDNIDLSGVSSRFNDETNFLSQNPYQFPLEDLDDNTNTTKLLIPRYRLEEVLDKLHIPDMIQFNQIWTCDILPIPGGITICEVSGARLVDVESFLELLASQLNRYEMTHCFILDTITKRKNRQNFMTQMRDILPSLFGIDPKEIHREFHEQAIFRCHVIHDDFDGGDAASLNDSNALSSILTITLCGLPEMILTIHEMINNIATSLSNSKVTGNGTLSCIPDEWSLRCHTVPYSLILLDEGSEEWNMVVALGQWETKTQKSQIKCIHRIENIELWRAYCSKRDGVERLRGDANEQWYWHGTRTLPPEVIAKEGFDFRVSNSGSYGRGAYFAHSINYSSKGYQHVLNLNTITPTHSLQSLAYNPTEPQPQPQLGTLRRSQPNIGQFGAQKPAAVGAPVAPLPSTASLPVAVASPFPTASSVTLPARQAPTTFNSVMNFPPTVTPGDAQLILARVCVGKTNVLTSSNSSLTRPPDGYDSVTGQTTMTIVYDLSMAYPSYIVTYR